jgi:hydroxyacylglutathione hydrolase
MRSLTPLPALADNYIWFADLGDENYLVVDPGESEPVEKVLSERDPRSLTILITHHHGDHIGGVPALRQRWAPRVVAPTDTRIASATERVEDSDVLELPGGLHAKVLAVAGHTRSHIAFLVGDVLFCGDTLFSLGCGRLFEGTPQQMYASLDKLRSLPPDTKVCCAHEYTLSNARFARHVDPDNASLASYVNAARRLRAENRPTLPSTIATECAANPFLRCREPAIRKAVGDIEGDMDPIEVFARLRRQKDDFRG